METTVTVTTSAGVFTRKTDLVYSHVLVWENPAAQRYLKQCRGRGERLWGFLEQLAKDHGYCTSWHRTQQLATIAWKRKPITDNDTLRLVGVFAIDMT